MSKFLELAELLEADSESEVDVWRGGIDAKFDVEGATEAEFCEEFLFGEDLRCAAAERFELGFGSLHGEREGEPVM